VSAPSYEYSLGLTSQFYFCALPLRLDAEPSCGFACLYCFSKARGGARRGLSAQVIDPQRLRRRLDRVTAGAINGAVDELLASGAAIHFGGMSDPFGRRPEVRNATMETIGILADHAHPTVISTKGLDAPTDALLEDLRRGSFLVQFSFSTLDDRLGQALEVGCPLPSRRLAAMRELSDAGVPVSARLQPLLPETVDRAGELIDVVARHGARHVGVEHLKVPLERQWPGTRRLSEALGHDVTDWYRRRGARRIGRELVLPVEDRLPTVIELRARAHRRRLSFGAADTDLLLLSDGDCCCSGADLHSAMRSFHRYTYPHAVRRSPPERIGLDALDEVWSPEGSIARWVNSKSRLAAAGERGEPLASYVRRNWNGRANGPSPALLWGVEPTGTTDAAGFALYRLTREAQRLTPHSSAAAAD
jgi:DNA repair photolyase